MNTSAKHLALGICIVTLAAAGCTRNHPRPIAMQTGQLELHGSGTSNSGTNIDPEEIGAEGRTAGVKTVYFDYNSYALRSDALTTLKDNATIFTRDVHGDRIQVEGHCDERGTQEYNLALGEQRALTVRHHLINLGIDGARISTLSYGEEHPADASHTEDAYALNRRCEFAMNVNGRVP